ncbi:hypothetical protein A7E78_02955 [Syntrophotalea acetylenivorans]|uniref:AB hydrolase-1 domain-containing protein n=1 Tax=Syntrophotalea acetylenivorans TaxID=1842532 RepID=A0A1L3GTG6_9BACT|nr:hypothetical protein A7E78_02955 [Syntrophotalea acetylenivorans]
MPLDDAKLTVVFAHGKESGPWGTKITLLAGIAKEHDCHVESVDFRGVSDPDVRVSILKAFLAKLQGPFFLVGSSMGAYVVTVASATFFPTAMLLLAPAVYLSGYAEQNPTPFAGQTVVVHGWHDQVVPVDNVLRFCREHSIELHVQPDGHQLLGSQLQIKLLFREMLQHVLCRF